MPAGPQPTRRARRRGARIDPLHAPAVRAALAAGQFDVAAHRGRALGRPDVVALPEPYR